MPQSAAATEAAMDAQGTKNVKGGLTVTVNMHFNDVVWNPGAFYDALNTLYGTVSNDNDSIQGDNYTYNLRISA